MKKILLCLLATFCCATLFAQDADAIVGYWKTGDGKGVIQVYKKDDRYFGKISWLAEPLDAATGKPKLDKSNDDEKLRNRSLLGLENLTHFRFAKKGVWEDGKIYDPKSGNTYSCTIKMPDANTLQVRGYVGVSLFGRTDTWKRMK